MGGLDLFQRRYTQWAVQCAPVVVCAAAHGPRIADRNLGVLFHTCYAGVSKFQMETF